MSDKEKKPSYLIWIMVAVGVLVLVLGVGFYLLWRKISSSEIRVATTSKTVDDHRVALAKLEQEIKSKDEKMQELVKEVAELKNKNTELTYQLKELKKGAKTVQQTNYPQGRNPIRLGQGSKNCDDGSCTTNVVEDLE